MECMIDFVTLFLEPFLILVAEVCSVNGVIFHISTYPVG